MVTHNADHRAGLHGYAVTPWPLTSSVVHHDGALSGERHG